MPQETIAKGHPPKLAQANDSDSDVICLDDDDDDNTMNGQASSPCNAAKTSKRFENLSLH